MQPPLVNQGSQYSQMALYNCYCSFEKGIYSPRLVKNVLKYKSGSLLNVECMVDFLDSDNEMIQRGAIEIIGEKGDVSLLLDMSKYVSSANKLLAIKYVLKKEELADEINEVLQTEDKGELLSAMKLFKDSGNVSQLLVLSFTEDNYIRNLVSRYVFGKKTIDDNLKNKSDK